MVTLINKKYDYLIALAGNPNTGKSTVFNSLTGLKQHTGNWPGKTVVQAHGFYEDQGHNFLLMDLPGTYSLWANSAEEEVTRDFLCREQPQVTVIVVDATCLERNLNLVLQILEITSKVVVCVNLLDEAQRKGITVDLARLSALLGVPVVGTQARAGKGLAALKKTITQLAGSSGKQKPRRVVYPEFIEKGLVELESLGIDEALWSRGRGLRLLTGNEVVLNREDWIKQFRLKHEVSSTELNEQIVHSLVKTAEQIGQEVLLYTQKDYDQFDRRLDRVLISKRWGLPIMLALLAVVFWLTIQGANYPSQFLTYLFFELEKYLTVFFQAIGTPEWLFGMLVLGVYRTLAWVVSVMLPPMAIFFPLFTLLEDLGYLPRIAFNLDNFFQRACAHGKQALTMCMGFGCNAAGVISCRIIESSRERLIAILTNSFVPCNGRFPALIAISTIFLVGWSGAWGAALIVLGVIILSVLLTLLVSWFLSQTILRGWPSSFTLELPPYRRPQIGRVIVRSIFDRTLFVLGRALLVAAPAGVIIWFLANCTVGEASLLSHCASFLEPFGYLLGLDGHILLAFLLGLPANEIVVPILTMSYLAEGSMLELDSLTALQDLFLQNGWTWLTALCFLIFVLNHFPCGTTLLTIYQETQSRKWAVVAFLLPTIVGLLLCFVLAQGVRFSGLV